MRDSLTLTTTMGNLPGAVMIMGLFLAISALASCGQPTLDDSGKVHLAYDESAGYRLIRNDEPFFVQGASGSSHLDVLANFGGNTVRVYNPDSLAVTLDRAGQLGLAVVADIPLPAYHPSPPGGGLSDTGLTDSIFRLVDRHRHHPALLFWMLGNEVFTQDYDRDYLHQFNAIAKAIRAIDPDHPISTGVIPHQLLKLQLSWVRPDVDFLSLNIFGNVTTLDRLLWYLTPIWRSPYLISEWGANGPWEEQNTLWGAPIEPPSSTKSRQLAERYTHVMPEDKNHRLLGSLVFYWGQKYERTPTWFSLFTPTGQVSEMAFSLGNLWQGHQRPFPGPRVQYLLLNELGAAESIVLPAGSRVAASAVFDTPPGAGLTASWEIRGEDWYGLGELGTGPEALPGLMDATRLTALSFTAPRRPGPYRLYYRVSDTAGYYATANIPFYVLSADDAQ